MHAVGEPLEVVVTTQNAAGMLTRSLLDHTIFLSAAVADGPARAKWALWLGHSAKCGCGYCVFSGVAGAGGGIYFKGYNEPSVQQQGPNEGEACHFDDPIVQLTDRCTPLYSSNCILDACMCSKHAHR